MTLTKRDKTLLQVLAVFVILVGFIYFLILPQMDRWQELNDSVAEAKETKQEMQMQISMLPQYEMQLTEQETALKEASKDFYPMQESHTLERMITKIFLDHGLTARDFEISAKPEYSALEPYFASVLAMEMGLSGPDAQDSTASQEEEPEQTVIYSSLVKVKAQGDRQNMEKLIDTIYASYPSMRITGYEISTGSALVGGSQVPAEVSVLDLQLEVYMSQKDE